MKKTIALMLVAIVASLSSTIYADKRIDQSELPKAAQEFISKYFPSDQVRKAEIDNDRRGVTYEVDLMSGAEIEFTSDGNWKDVKAARGEVVPEGIVPAAILKYVNKNFEDQDVVEISRERSGFEVELSNGSELKLTADAKPMQPRRRHK